MKTKTIIFVVNDKGGIGKSTTAAFVGDALQKLGYTVLYLSGDQTTNIVLKTLQPTTRHFYIRNKEEVDDAMKLALNAKEDVIIYDLPGNSSPDAAEYFAAQGFEMFRDLGLRFVLAIAAIQHKDSVVGSIQWIETFLDHAEPIIFANGSRTPLKDPFNMTKVEGGADLIELAENRVIEVPRLSPESLKLYNDHPAVPTSYFADGEMGKRLGIDCIKSNPWRTLHISIVRSVSKHAEWITGKPIPKPLDPEQQGPDTPKTNSVLERLKLKYSDALTGDQPEDERAGMKTKTSE